MSQHDVFINILSILVLNQIIVIKNESATAKEQVTKQSFRVSYLDFMKSLKSSKGSTSAATPKLMKDLK